MLLYSRGKHDIQFAPEIEICSYLTHFGHEVTWVISLEKKGQLKMFHSNGTKVYAIPYRRYFPGDSTLAQILNEIIHTLKRAFFISKIFKKGRYNIIFENLGDKKGSF